MSGSAPCCRLGSPATTRGGWTSCVWPARWPGDGCPRDRTGPPPTVRWPPRPSRNSTIPRGGRRGSATPSSATPLALVTRPDLTWMLAAVRTDREVVEPTAGASADVLGALRSEGARFRSELASAAGRLETEVDEGLWDLVARGIVTADAFSAVRSLLSARRRRPTRRPGTGRRSALGRRRALVGTGVGRGPLVPAAPTRRDRDGAARRAGVRGTGRGGGLAAAGPLGRGGLGAVDAGVVPDPLAGRGAGPAAAGGPRRGPGRAVRGRHLGRAVCLARGGIPAG